VTYILYGEGCTDDARTLRLSGYGNDPLGTKILRPSDVAEVTAKILLYPTDYVAKILELT
jgi:hypothetical protein